MSDPRNSRLFRERWHRSTAPHLNRVDAFILGGSASDLPAAPCFNCKARGPCKHREPQTERA